jgi:hypothetical protein
VFFTAIVTATISIAVANQQMKNARDTEELKSRLGQLVPKRHEAYHAMWRAATEYYMALNKLQLGSFPEEEIKEADKTRNVAFGESLLALREDVDNYYSYMQEANYLKERAEEIKDNPDALKSLWRENGREFGLRYEGLRVQFYNRLIA